MKGKTFRMEKKMNADKEQFETVMKLIYQACVLKEATAKEEVLALLTGGMDLNAFDETGRTLLTCCLQDRRYHQMVDELIKAGASIHQPTKYGKTPLMCAVSSPFFVQYLLERGADIEAVDIIGRTALSYAVYDKADPRSVRLLLQAGSDVNHQDCYGLTPFALMLEKGGNFWHARILRAYGADLSLKDKKGKTVFDVVGENESVELLNELRGMPAKEYLIPARKTVQSLKQEGRLLEEELLRAAKEENEALLYALIEAGVDANYQNPQTLNTALHYAVQSGSIYNIQLLIEQHVDMNKKNEHGDTPLTACLASGKNSHFWDGWLLELLLLKGADVNLDGSFCRYPLHFSAEVGDEKAIKMFVQNGADVFVRDSHGRTPADVYVQAFNDMLDDRQKAFLDKWLKKNEPQKINIANKKALMQKRDNQNEG